MATLHIQDSYSLSPLQGGMLFHSLDNQASGVDIEQIICFLTEDLEAIAFLRAWERVVDRHPILRTSFHWEDRAEPHQDVYAQVTIPVLQQDWRTLNAAEKEQRWQAFLAEDRARGFVLSQAPLMRLSIIRYEETRYRVLWTFHHILLDGRSFPLVLREVFALYEAISEGRTLDVPEPRPYRDYIRWLKEYDLTAAETYWRRTLKGFRAPTVLLPSDVPTGTGPDSLYQGVHEFRLSAHTTRLLQILSQRYQLSTNAFLQGAWAILLHRYSGETDVVFGATRACRRSTFPDADSMVGLFINTLPLRVQVDPQALLLDWLKELRTTQVQLRQFEHTPLAKVMSWSEVPRGTDLFDSIIVFENYLLDTALRASAGKWINRQFLYLGQTNFPLTIVAYADEELLIRVEYDRRRWSDATAGRIAGHLAKLLDEMAVDPQRRLREFPIVSREEETLLLSYGNHESIVYPKEASLHQLFELQVAQTPEAVAVTYERQMITYRELNQRANRLARILRTHQVGPNVLVGLCVERSVEMVIGILGILKAGGAYVPLDPSYPKDRLAFMVADSGLSVLLTQRHLDDVVPGQGMTVCYLDADTAVSSVTDLHDDTNLRHAITADDLAYVIYTSGSTGKPKGAQITHGNAVRLFHATDAWFHFGSSDVWTLFHSYAFDFSVWELWGALLYGGRLVVVPYWVSRSPEAFATLLKSEGVTILNQTPSAFRQLIPFALATISPDEMALRSIVFGGEALELQSLQPWFDRYGDQHPRLINMYGITETTVHVTYRPITIADVHAGIGSVIGKPIPDLKLYVLNSDKQIVPIGVNGEMYVGGAGVGKGYLHRPELTAERFIPHLFSNEAGAMLYRSGDLARWLPNGDLEYLGRIDHQVKIRGFRIELGEIEAVLSQHASIREVVVIAREDSPGDKRLVAYFVADDALAVDELRVYLKTALPEYMVPAAFVRLPTLPLTPNGKVDRRALPVPDLVRPDLGQNYVAPSTFTEETLCGIWSVVLGVERVGVHDNFFELGGDSILSIQIIAKARQAGLPFSPRDLFKNPTISELAVLSPQHSPIQAEQGLVTGTAPLTPIQLWLFEQHLSDLHHWNQSFLFETVADIDLATLGEALRHVVQHHDALRLRFSKDAGGWHQSHAETIGDIAIVQQDFSTVPTSDHSRMLVTAATGLQSSLNLAEGPLIRAAYFSFGAGHTGCLLLILHHLVVDGVSWRIFMEDLESAYTALRDHKPVTLPAKTTAFQTWALHLKEYAQHPSLREAYTYWQQLLSNCGTQIPVDLSPAGCNSEASAQTVTITLSREETRALLQHVPTAYHTQINDVLLTALGRSLGSWVSGDSLLVDLEGHGREDIGDNSDLSRTVGWFTAIFPVLVNLRQDLSEEEALRQTKEQLRQIPHRGLSYGALRYLCNDAAVSEVLSAHPQAPIAFNYLGQFDQVLADSSLFRFANESCGPWHSPTSPRRHLIEVLSLVSGGCFEVRWTYSQNLHQRKTIEDLANVFIAVLRSFIALSQTADSRHCTIDDFPAGLEQATRDRMLREYKGVEDIYSLSPMQRLFYSMDAANSRLGFEQWHLTLTGPLNVEAFKQAWGQVINRHSILRSAFVSDGLAEPVQLVFQHVTPLWTEHDWRFSSQDEQKRRIADVLEQDSQQRFNLAQPPLVRFILIRVAEGTYNFLWSTHHLLIDGWSWPVLFNELSAYYEAAKKDVKLQLDVPCPYRDYIAWLQQRSESDAERFWRQQLDGITMPTLLALRRSHVKEADARELIGEEVGYLSASATAKLQSFTRAHQLTLNSVLQGAWALLLSQYRGTSDVLFGAAFSGRSPEVSGIEAMVGPCVNNVPVRVRVDASNTLVSWLQGIQERQFEASQHQYSSLLQIQEWSQIPWRYRLFDSLVVFQNYVVGEAGQRLGADIAMQVLAVPEATNYPITVTVVPGTELRLKISFQREHCEGEYISRILADLKALLEAIAKTPTQSVAELLATLPQLTVQSYQDTAAALSSQNGTTSASNGDIVPQTEMEQVVAKIWRELFQSDQVSMEESFFDVGGHSLLLVQVHKRLQESLNRILPIVMLFQYPTIRSLARNLGGTSDQQRQLSDVQQRAKRQQEALARQQKMARRS